MTKSAPNGRTPHAATRLAAFGLIAAGASMALLAGCGGSTDRPADIGWPLWGNTPQDTHYAQLSQIDAANVSHLKLAWSRSEGPGQFSWETFPVVVGKTMYYSTDTDEVFAVDATSGKVRWSYLPQVDFLAGPGGLGAAPVSRGVTVADGRVYELTYDDQLIALDQRTGKPLWNVRVNNPNAGFSETSPGTYWHGEIIIGGPAGDAGLRGFVAAYDADTGKRLWRTYVVPAPGHEWMPRKGAHGGGDVWMPPVVDPATGTVYVSTGDPTPAFSARDRPGCDRWSDATLALDASTGALKWGHKEVCDDSWDYDTDQSPVLMKLEIGGHSVQAVGAASKSGFYSTLDASTGALIAKTPHLTRYSRPHRDPRQDGTIVCPGIFGGIEYGPSAFSAATGDLYIAGTNMCMRYVVNSKATIEHHGQGQPDLEGTAAQSGPASGVLDAVDASTGRVRWSHRLPKPATGGTLATAGGLVFVGDDDGYLYAFGQRTGKMVWRRDLGLRFGSAPISYEIDGVQYIAIAAGGSQLQASGDAPGGGRLFVFRLGDAP